MHFERVGILVNINMFDSLLHRNTKLEYEPSLATSWKAINDTTWEFKLRKGVKFHNGDPLTAEDVKFSFERVTRAWQGEEEVAAVRQHPRDQGSQDRRRRDDPHRHRQAVPAAAGAAGVLPDRAQEAHREGRRRGVRHHGRRSGPGPGSSWSGSAISTSGSRPSTAHWRGKPAVQAPRVPRHPRGRHAGRRDEDGRRGPHPQRVGRSGPRAEGQSADVRVVRRRSCACTTSSSTCGSRPSTRRRCGRRPTTRSTSRPSSRS